MSDLAEYTRTKRVLITVGAGGVGKTTMSAATALHAAQSGRRTLVITIDPAKRLATSLCVGTLGEDPQEVKGLGVPPQMLYAMTLNPKQTFDRVIEEHSPDDKSFKRILANKIYQEISTRLAGGLEYAAVEKLYEVDRRGEFDLVVLDTPPTANAFDFFDAPRRMINALDSPAVRLLLSTYQKAGLFSAKFLSFGAAFVFRGLGRLVGAEFIEDIAQFFSDVSILIDGFKERAVHVEQLFQRSDVGIFVVTTPDARGVDQAVALQERIQKFGRSTDALIVNRVIILKEVIEKGDPLQAELAKQGIVGDKAEALAGVLAKAHGHLLTQARADQREIGRLMEAFHNADFFRVPLQLDEVYELSRLSKFWDQIKVFTERV